MRSLQGIPFLRIIIPFILGIVLFSTMDSLSPFYILGISAISLLFTIYFLRFSFDKKIKWFWLNGITIHLLLIGLGWAVSYVHRIENKKSWYKHHIKNTSKMRAQILTPLKETAKTYKANVEINTIYHDDKKLSCKGEAILYFKKSKDLSELRIGDQILITNKLSPILSKGNPGEFNYAAFCQNRGIYDQAFLTINEWQKLDIRVSGFQNPFPHWHESIKNILAHYISDSNAIGIAQALITGYRDDIDNEIYNEYTKTGLVHILAISGLHMGIFYLGAQFFLGIIPFFKRRKRLLLIVALACMWLFALVTTFPPSVQRAGLMISFLVIGQLVSRKIDSLNFLFASAFVLLLFQPHLLWEVGFQLSYAAVLGILLFFKPLSKLLNPKNLVARKAWQIMCVSLTAQAFTFPISLYYFHQIPSLFLLTNVVAIPMVTLIIYGEVFLVIFSFIPGLAKIIGTVVSFLITTLNQFIHFTSSLSFVNISNVDISLPQCFLLLGMVLSLAAWLLDKRKIFAPIAILLFLVFTSISINKKNQVLQQEKLVVYNADSTYLEYLSGSTAFLYDSIALDKRNSFAQYITQPCYLKYGIRKGVKESAKVSNDHFDLIIKSGTKILRIKKAYKLKFSRPIDVDYLILSDKWIKKPTELLSMIKPKELIIDGNIPMWKIEELKSQLQEVDLPTHYITTQGAKTIPL